MRRSVPRKMQLTPALSPRPACLLCHSCLQRDFNEPSTPVQLVSRLLGVAQEYKGRTFLDIILPK